MSATESVILISPSMMMRIIFDIILVVSVVSIVNKRQ